MAKGDYERALKLKESGLISEEEFSKKETAYLRAQVDYQKALLSFTGSEAKVVVESATKWMDERGKLHVRVSILYSARELESLFSSGIKEELFPVDFLKDMKNVYISLLSDGFIISEPYQRKIERISLGERKEVDFVLLKDIESLEVSLFYSGKEEKRGVYLLKEASTNIVTMSSSQFSQEADLGGEAVFDLSLERFTREGSDFRLSVIGLPKEIACEFVEPQSSARLSQIRFPEGVTSMKLKLRLFLPKNPSSEIQIDKPISFYALCLSEEEWRKVREGTEEKRGKGTEEQRVKTYRDLLVWQKSMELVTQIYRITETFPKDENYGLTFQIRKSAVSIPSNIAEGYGRKSTDDYIRFLQIAISSLFELQTQLEIALNLCYLPREKYEEVYESSREIERMLSSISRKLREK